MQLLCHTKLLFVHATMRPHLQLAVQFPNHCHDVLADNHHEALLGLLAGDGCLLKILEPQARHILNTVALKAVAHLTCPCVLSKKPVHACVCVHIGRSVTAK